MAEDRERLVVYGGSGKAARNPEALRAIERSLTGLAPDETLLVQSGKPVGVLRTFEHAPRVLIANSLLVPDWATWEEFWALEQQGLTMYGQMTAGSWIYIGTQGIVQGTFQTFAALAELRFDGTLRATTTLTAGLGGMGGAQPLAITLNGGVALCVEVDPARIQRRLETRYLDEQAEDLDAALARADAARAAGEAVSIGVVGNAAEVFPELLRRGAAIDVVTDQTSAHDPLNGYVPEGLTLDEAAELRAAKPTEYVERARASMARHCEAMVGFQHAGAEVFDYGNNLRGEARLGGFADAFAYPGFVPAYIRPLFCEGMGPFRWVALSGDPADIAATDEALLGAFPDDPLRAALDPDGTRARGVPGPARAHLLAGLRRAGQGGRDLQRPRRQRCGEGPDRDRPRPPRLRLRGLALPRDRGHGRRLRRDRRLADPQRAAQRGVRRRLGRRAPRGRRRHGQVHPLRRPGRRRRHRGGGRTPRPRPHQRPRHGRDAPRRRRLRPRARGRRRAWRAHPDGSALIGDLAVTGIGRLVTWDPERPVIDRAALIALDGTVAWVGEERDLPEAAPAPRLDAGGRAVIPGFVDAHTHPVFAGERASEFAARMAGLAYSAGGIRSTVAATRAATDAELAATRAGWPPKPSARAPPRWRPSPATASPSPTRSAACAPPAPSRTRTTFLGAHVVPAEHAGDRDGYVALVIGPMLDACAPHADWIDVFCEEGAFDLDETRAILEAGRAKGLGLRVHTNQLQPSAGARLAAELGAASADHCTHVDDADIAALAGAGVVATLVPAAEFCTRSRYAPARRLLDAGATVALATDCNPGTSYTTSMPFVIALAVSQQHLTVEEALRAATLGGAASLRLADVGHLRLGARADLVVLDAPDPVHLAYRPGVPIVHTVVRGGSIVTAPSRG